MSVQICFNFCTCIDYYVNVCLFAEILDPEVKISSLSIVSPDRDDIVLPIPADGNPKGLWFTLKEGSHYRLKFTFEVSNNIVSGLKYTNTVWKTGVKGKLFLPNLFQIKLRICKNLKQHYLIALQQF